MTACPLKLLAVALLLSGNAALALVYPAASVQQFTICMSAPIEIPDRKIFLNWCLQMNYDLPKSPAQFYNAPIWANLFKGRQQRGLSRAYNNSSINIDYAKYNVAPAHSARVHPNDFTAGELYHSLENLLVRYGFHETCLLRSVCELALHPFAAQHRNLLTELLIFLLSPSLHQSFSKAEHLYRSVYEVAEAHGEMGLHCAALYSDCSLDLLTAITKTITNSN